MSWREKSFDVLPALKVGGPPLRTSLRRVTVAWMFGVVWMSCISGSQMTLFGRLLGFRDYHFGLLGAIPFAATFAQLIAAIVIERTGLRKYMFIFNASIHRLLWLAIAAVPLVLSPGRTAVVAFMLVYAASCVLAQLSIPPWQTWMGDLIPRRIRGRYFASRRRWTLPVQMAVVIAAGLALDRAAVPGAAMDVAHQPTLLLTICGLFAVGAVFGTIDILFFRGMREIVSPPLSNGRTGSPARPLKALSAAFAEPFRVVREAFGDRVFRHYALYGATVGFAMTVGGQFFWLNALENIGYSKVGANMVFMVSGGLSSLLVIRLWGGLIDRWGRRPVLILGTLGAVLGPTAWFFIPPGDLFLGYLLGGVACVWGSAMWSGVILAQTNLVMGFCESSGRSRHIAAAGVVVAVGGFLGGLAGGGIAESFGFLRHEPIHLGPFVWINYHVNFLVSALARAAAVLWLIGMPDPGAKPVRDVVRQVRFNVFNNVMTRVFWRLRSRGHRLLARRHARQRPEDRNAK